MCAEQAKTKKGKRKKEREKEERRKEERRKREKTCVVVKSKKTKREDDPPKVRVFVALHSLQKKNDFRQRYKIMI